MISAKFGLPKVIFEKDYCNFGLSYTHIIFDMHTSYGLTQSKKEVLGTPCPKNNVNK